MRGTRTVVLPCLYRELDPAARWGIATTRLPYSHPRRESLRFSHMCPALSAHSQCDETDSRAGAPRTLMLASPTSQPESRDTRIPDPSGTERDYRYPVEHRTQYDSLG